VPLPTPGPYVDEALITDPEDKDTVLRVDKLLALVRELNANYADQHPYACQMLLRAILDHVPPTFVQSTFQCVVANVSWGRTDKAYVKKLAEFRNGADDVCTEVPLGEPSDRPSAGTARTPAEAAATCSPTSPRR
jgi:hypothetical protein